MSSANENAVTFLRGLAAQGFWGFVTLKFENGHVVHVRREENLKPNELPCVQGQLPGKDRRDEDDYNREK